MTRDILSWAAVSNSSARLIASICTMGVLMLFASSGLCAGHSAASFSFPSKIGRVSSVSGTLFASYRDPGENEDGIHEYRFSVTERDNRELAGFTFLRSVSGAWSSSSDGLFVNNFIGSNVSDCLVLTKSGNTLSFKSLTEVLNNKTTSGPADVSTVKPPESPANSHYYLTCEKWSGEQKITVLLTGTTDAGGSFKYRFWYDVSQQRFHSMAP